MIRAACTAVRLSLVASNDIKSNLFINSSLRDYVINRLSLSGQLIKVNKVTNKTPPLSEAGFRSSFHGIPQEGYA
jgi:hypothetical protein